MAVKYNFPKLLYTHCYAHMVTHQFFEIKLCVEETISKLKYCLQLTISNKKIKKKYVTLPLTKMLKGKLGLNTTETLG